MLKRPGLEISSEHLVRLDLLRFPLIVLVVYIHAFGTSVRFGESTLGLPAASGMNALVQYSIAEVLARIAVPTFFFMAGYLFFRSDSLDVKQYKKKIYNRVYTLMMPFIFWNVFVFILEFYGNKIQLVSPLFDPDYRNFESLSLMALAAKVFGTDYYPISYQFWFIRDLMILGIISPIIYVIIRQVGLVALLVLFFLWFLQIWPLYTPDIEPVFFFVAGAYLALTRRSPFCLDQWGPWLTLIYLVCFGLAVSFAGDAFGQWPRKLSIALGVVVVLYLSRFAARNAPLCRALVWLAPASFFVFAIHEPFLTIVKTILYLHIPWTQTSILLVYLILPMVMVSIATVLYVVATRASPRFMSIIVGRVDHRRDIAVRVEGHESGIGVDPGAAPRRECGSSNANGY